MINNNNNNNVCEQNTPPEKKTLERVSMINSKSGTGEQFLLLD